MQTFLIVGNICFAVRVPETMLDGLAFMLLIARCKLMTEL